MFMMKRIFKGQLALQLFFYLSIAVLLNSCAKEQTDSSDLVGNWVRGYEFEGNGRTEAVSFIIGNDVYIGGGYDGKKRLTDFWKYNPQTGSWLRIADFPGTARSAAVAFSIDNKAYVGTGYDDDDNYLRDFWMYDPVSNVWTRKADFGGTARYDAVGFALNGKGFLGTGYDGSYLKDMWQYDPVSNSWEQKASMGGSKRSGASVFIRNGLAYIVAGLNNGAYLTDFWVYEPTSNTWTEKRKINDASSDEYDDDYEDYIRRANAMTFILNDKGYLISGSRSGVINSVWEYNFGTDTWKEKTAFEGSAREGGIGFTVGSKAFITTGNNSSYRFDDLWEFQPEAEQNDDDN